MAKSHKKPKPEVELEPDAWDRFQRTVNKIVPPKKKAGEPKPSGPESGPKQRRKHKPS